MDKSLFPPLEGGAKNDQEAVETEAPLADRMRPRQLEQVLGQDHLLGKGKILSEVIAADRVPSLLLWGPPGTGKTTLARLIAGYTRSHFVALSAVLAGVKDVKRVVEEAKAMRQASRRHTLLFVDEIHRFNKAQQDAFLPHVESGLLTLIGATTENPSFEVIAPLLSRSRVLVLRPLEESHLVQILRRALSDEKRGLGDWGLQVGDEELRQIAGFANGDARAALNALETVAQLARRQEPASPRITSERVKEALQTRTLLYDKAGEEHFNLISALHKSLRNSDVDASLYWLGRMLEAGEDPLYIARRMVRFASEDVGTADPAALGQSLDAVRAVQFIGLPEGKLALAQAAIYLAQAPKSNAVYRAYSAVSEDVQTTRNEPVPLQLRNAPTSLMKSLGYGQDYRYAHDQEEGVADMDCLPETLAGRRYYQPSQVGYEKEIVRRLESIHAARRGKR